MARVTRSSVAGRVDLTAVLFRDQRLTIRTYLPADYEWTDRDYRVIYMFDAYNLFDRTTATYHKEWRIDETMEQFSAQGVEPAIVAAIDAPRTRFERFAMYSVGQWDYRKVPDGRRLRRIDGYGRSTPCHRGGQRHQKGCSYRQGQDQWRGQAEAHRPHRPHGKAADSVEHDCGGSVEHSHDILQTLSYTRSY